MPHRPLLAASLLSCLAALALNAAGITSPHPGNFFVPGETLALHLDLGALPESSPPADVVLLDYRNHVLDSQNLSPSDDAPGRFDVAFPPAASGFYRVEVRGGKDRMLLAATTLGVLPASAPASPDPSARFGTIAHLKHMDDAERETMLDLITRAGIGWIREGFLWQELEPSPGDWHTDRYDDLVARSLRHGVNVLPILSYGNAWAAEDGDADQPAAILRQMAPRMDAWQTYVRHMVLRYGDRLHAWEIWNEPNGITYWRPHPDAQAYARIAAGACAVIKKLAPAATVLTGGFGPAKTDRPDIPSRDENLFLRTLDALAPRPYDVIAYHPYTVFHRGVSPSRTARLFQENFDHLLGNDSPSSVPIWITEIGVSTIPRICTEEEAAGHLAVVLTLSSARPDVRKVFLYNFRDVGTDPKNKEDMFGLLHRDFTPKPGYFAYRTFINLLGRAAFVRRTDQKDGAVIHEFSTPASETIQVVWSATGAPITAQLEIPAASAQEFDVVGDMTQPSVNDGHLSVKLDSSPIYLKFRSELHPPAAQ